MRGKNVNDSCRVKSPYLPTIPGLQPGLTEPALQAEKIPHSVARRAKNGNAQAQFLPHAIEWAWRGDAPKKSE